MVPYPSGLYKRVLSLRLSLITITTLTTIQWETKLAEAETDKLRWSHALRNDLKKIEHQQLEIKRLEQTGQEKLTRLGQSVWL